MPAEAQLPPADTGYDAFMANVDDVVLRRIAREAVQTTYRVAT